MLPARHVAGFVAFVLVAVLLATGLDAVVRPALGLPALYGTAATAAVGAPVVGAVWVLFGDVDTETYFERGREVVVADFAIAGLIGLVTSALVVTGLIALGLADAAAEPGEAFAESGPRVLSTGLGLGAGIYAFYRRTD
ncbi:hypothetical protein [Natronorarus salvus]|uniref:hypothetical protein n=1 Tax=Natronorarus salvus TaxID=3117733 RepID=UPI002F260567